LQADIKDRKSLVDTHRTRWGDDWIILPNPAYGEWTRPLGRGNDDLNRLAPELK
jgi:predicted secreted acid phosphatase